MSHLDPRGGLVLLGKTDRRGLAERQPSRAENIHRVGIFLYRTETKMPRTAGHFRSSSHLCCFSLLIDRGFCDLSQCFVGGLFLFERFLQERDCIFETELFGPGYQRAVT